MTFFRRLTSKKVLLGTALLVGGLMTGPLTAREAGATFSTCSTDPKLFLSNGMKVTITTSIADSSSDVTGITYTVHGQVGTTVTGVVFTGSAFDGKETVVYVPDETMANTYDTDVVVNTLSGGISTSQTSQVLDQYNGIKTSATGSAFSGQDMLAHLSY